MHNITPSFQIPKSFVRPPHGKIEDFPRSPPKGGSLIEKRNFLGMGLGGQTFREPLGEGGEMVGFTLPRTLF